MLILVFAITVVSYADFSGNTTDYTFDRSKAKEYMEKYWNNYNIKDYADFTAYGGDCTNFASQVLRAGGVSFTSRTTNPTYNHWYYYGPNWGYDRTATWTGATEFRQHFGDIKGTGKKRAVSMYTFTVSEALENFDFIWLRVSEGDIISHGHDLNSSYHTQIVYDYTIGARPRDIKVAQHTANYLDRSLREYLEQRVNAGQGNEYVFLIEVW